MFLNVRAEQAVDDAEAHLEAGPAALVAPAEHLLVVMHEHVLESFRGGTQDVALGRVHQDVVELGESSRNETIRERLGAILDEERQEVGSQLDSG
jgi:hypothetical protein